MNTRLSCIVRCLGLDDDIYQMIKFAYSYCQKYVPVGSDVCDSRNPPVPLSKRGNGTRMKLHELNNSDNEA